MYFVQGEKSQKNFIEETKPVHWKILKTIIKRPADELTDEEKISDQGMMSKEHM